jgi:hypothetical protein
MGIVNGQIKLKGSFKSLMNKYRFAENGQDLFTLLLNPLSSNVIESFTKQLFQCYPKKAINL